jgi:hypothetical protein
MAFDVDEPTAPPKKTSTDEMVALSHMAGRPVKVATKKIAKPIPKEARRGFYVAMGLFLALALISFLRAH